MNAILKEASAKYELKNREWKLVKSAINFIFESKDEILQFTPIKYKLKNELLIETSWIEYLNQSGFEVVKLIKSKEKKVLEEVNGFTVICYEKIVGTKATRSTWSDMYFQKLGTFTGKLHKLGKAFEAENKFHVKNWNEISKGKFIEYLPRDKRELVKLYEVLIDEFNTYKINKNNFGIIHYDIHHGNYFLIGNDKRIKLFDFEMTCKSWYINDIAVILYYILNSVPISNRTETRDLFFKHFFRGYEEENKIVESEKLKIPKFLLYRDLLVYGFTFRIWKEENEMTENELKFRNKLSDSIDRRIKKLNL